MSISTVVAQQAQYRARVQPYHTCAQGPRTIYHTVPGYCFYPPIQKGSCDNIASSTCVSKSEEWRSKCVLVSRYRNGRWMKLGYRIVRYLHHISCHNKQCPSITCPSGQYFDSSTCMCKCNQQCPSNKRLKFNTCQCECAPKTCPIGQRLNPTTCNCECLPITCPSNKVQNTLTCGCECRQRNFGCFELNEDTCECECGRNSFAPCGPPAPVPGRQIPRPAVPRPAVPRPVVPILAPIEPQRVEQ